MPREETDVYAALLEAIDRGAFPPGARLVELDLAERFAVSRTPVREALNRLESQGVVARDGKRGLTVAVLDYDQLGELYACREELEGFAARLAARHAAPTEIAVLAARIEADRAAVEDAEALAHSNRLFHRQLHLAGHNRYLNQMLTAMRRSLVLLSGTTLQIEARRQASVAEHAQIVAAIQARDEDQAEAAARAHIQNAYRLRLDLETGR